MGVYPNFDTGCKVDNVVGALGLLLNNGFAGFNNVEYNDEE